MTKFDQVKDSGERRAFGTGSVRDVREGKGRYDLLEPHAIKRIAQHFENGAAKYGDNNWRLGQPLSGYLDSGIRHCFNLLEGKTDEDHAAAAAWNLMAFISTKHWIDEGTLPSELDDIEWDDSEYGETPIRARERAVDQREREMDKRDKMVERAYLENLLPEFEEAVVKAKTPTRQSLERLQAKFVADAAVASPGEVAQSGFEEIVAASLRTDGELKGLLPRYATGIAEPRADEPWVTNLVQHIEDGEDVVVLSGEPASLLQSLIDEAKHGHPDEITSILDDFLASIADVDKDKTNSVGSDRPTNTDQNGGTNVR